MKFKKMFAGMGAVALAATLFTGASATVAPAEGASAWTVGGVCSTAAMRTEPNWRVTLYPYMNKYYFWSGQAGLDWLESGTRSGELHKRVAVFNSRGECISHWQWKYTVKNAVSA